MTWDDHYFEERLTRNTTELHMPMITNQEMRKALTIVIELAKVNTIPKFITDEPTVAIRNEQLKAIALVERLQTLLFMHNLTRTREDDHEQTSK
jgi:hypothetical protein